MDMRTRDMVTEMVTKSKVLVGSRMNLFEMGTRVMMDMMIEELMARMPAMMSRVLSKMVMSEMGLRMREMGYMFELGTKVMYYMVVGEMIEVTARWEGVG